MVASKVAWAVEVAVRLMCVPAQVVEDVGRWCGQWVLLIGRRFLVFTIHVFQLFVNLFGGAIEFA